MFFICSDFRFIVEPASLFLYTVEESELIYFCVDPLMNQGTRTRTEHLYIAIVYSWNCIKIKAANQDLSASTLHFLLLAARRRYFVCNPLRVSVLYLFVLFSSTV